METPQVRRRVQHENSMQRERLARGWRVVQGREELLGDDYGYDGSDASGLFFGVRV